jgi:hypothetical protein
MDRTGRRRFTITDAMVFIAATAFGLALARKVYPHDLLRPTVGSYTHWFLNGPAACLVAAWAMALVFVRLRRPRPHRRRLMRQPGFVACTASLLALALGSVCGRIVFGTVFFNLHGYNNFQVEDYWSWAIRPTGPVVLGAWVGLWLAGRSSAEKSGIDRMGRAVGLFWIAGAVWIPIGTIVRHLFPRL